MQAHFERTARVPLWIAGIAACVLAASGVVAIVRAIPASYASIPDDRAASAREAGPSGSDELQARVATAPVTGNRRTRTSCPECGTIESMHRVERSSYAVWADTVVVGMAAGVSGGGRDSGVAAHVPAEESYEITARFRDGSRTVFSEATPRAWRPGSRVIVIGGARTAGDGP